MQRLGYGKLTLRNLTDLRVASISAKSIEEYRAAGYGKLTLRELTEFGLHGVTPKYIEDGFEASGLSPQASGERGSEVAS